MAMHRAEHLYVTKAEGPFAVVRACKLCKFYDSRRKPVSGGLRSTSVGRGNGFREGNKQRGRMIEHLKIAHPAEYAAAMTKTL